MLGAVRARHADIQRIEQTLLQLNQLMWRMRLLVRPWMLRLTKAALLELMLERMLMPVMTIMIMKLKKIRIP